VWKEISSGNEMQTGLMETDAAINSGDNGRVLSSLIAGMP
jgi:hypothetical protein